MIFISMPGSSTELGLLGQRRYNCILVGGSNMTRQHHSWYQSLGVEPASQTRRGAGAQGSEEESGWAHVESNSRNEEAVEVGCTSRIN